MNYFGDTNKKEESIRHNFDEKSGEFYFSIVDIIENIGLSTDSRNYWKVLKNRLKTTHNKLVTECNQLKMKANDDKYYLTDVAKASTLLQIIQIISPLKVAEFEEFFNYIERKNFKTNINSFNEQNEKEELSTDSIDDGEIKADVYKKDNCIFINMMLAGVSPDNIFVSLNYRIVTIKFNRLEQNNTEKNNYDIKELSWGRFSRVISLPFEVDIDRVETNFNHGLLSIQLFILDKTRIKIIKIKE
jgi:HSP20 family molecular chaperone IbpA